MSVSHLAEIISAGEFNGECLIEINGEPVLYCQLTVIIGRSAAQSEIERYIGLHLRNAHNRMVNIVLGDVDRVVKRRKTAIPLGVGSAFTDNHPELSARNGDARRDSGEINRSCVAVATELVEVHLIDFKRRRGTVAVNTQHIVAVGVRLDRRVIVKIENL